MDSTQFMGLLIGALVTLLGIASIIVAILIKPIINLNRSIQKLTDSIERLDGANANLKSQVSDHEKAIDENKLHLARHDKDIDYLKEILK